MARVSLVWLECPGLEGLDPATIARGAGVELFTGGIMEAAVVSSCASAASTEIRSRMAGKPTVWLNLAAEVGGGDDAHRLARAIAAVSRAAGRAAKATLPPVYAPQPAQNVLVAGAGVSALTAAFEAAALGHPVVLATPLPAAHLPGAGEDPEATSLLAAQLPAGVMVLAETEVDDLTGAAGGFEVWFRGQEASQRFGAVVLCPPGELAPADQAPGLADELIAPLSGLDPERVSGPADGWLNAAVLAGVAAPLTAEAFEQAAVAAKALQERDRVQVTMLYSEARVATENGERAFRAAREAGVLPMRVDTGGLAVAEGGRALAWHDHLLQEDVELFPDLVVVPDAPESELPVYLRNPVKFHPWSQLAPDKPRFGGGRTSRTGLYILGALRGTAPSDYRQEAVDAAADLHDRLTGQVVPMPAVRHDYCASCLTCVRVCPHGVPRYQGADHVVCAPAGCIACGVCAAECPAEAIAPPGWSNAEMFAGLEHALNVAAQPKLVLFACRQSAAQAMAELSARGHVWPAGLVVYPVQCAGRVGQQLILKSMSLGARGVLVAGCHDGNCRSVTGNLRAKLRTGEAAELLAEIGLGAERVRFLHMASNQPLTLARAVEELADAVKED